MSSVNSDINYVNRGILSRFTKLASANGSVEESYYLADHGYSQYTCRIFEAKQELILTPGNEQRERLAVDLKYVIASVLDNHRKNPVPNFQARS